MWRRRLCLAKSLDCKTSTGLHYIMQASRVQCTRRWQNLPFPDLVEVVVKGNLVGPHLNDGRSVGPDQPMGFIEYLLREGKLEGK